MSKLYDHLIEDHEVEVAFWIDSERHDAGATRVILDRGNYVACALTGKRIVDMIEEGLDVSVYLRPNTAAHAKWTK